MSEAERDMFAFVFDATDASGAGLLVSATGLTYTPATIPTHLGNMMRDIRDNRKVVDESGGGSPQEIAGGGVYAATGFFASIYGGRSRVDPSKPKEPVCGFSKPSLFETSTTSSSENAATTHETKNPEKRKLQVEVLHIEYERNAELLNSFLNPGYRFWQLHPRLLALADDVESGLGPDPSPTPADEEEITAPASPKKEPDTTKLSPKGSPEKRSVPMNDESGTVKDDDKLFHYELRCVEFLRSSQEFRVFLPSVQDLIYHPEERLFIVVEAYYHREGPTGRGLYWKQCGEGGGRKKRWEERGIDVMYDRGTSPGNGRITIDTEVLGTSTARERFSIGRSSPMARRVQRGRTCVTKRKGDSASRCSC